MIFSKKWIKKVRQKPEDEQKMVALILAFVLTSFIATAWVITIYTNIGKPNISIQNFSWFKSDAGDKNQAGIIESVTNFFQGEETYIID
jgi:hypothetical protein